MDVPNQIYAAPGYGAADLEAHGLHQGGPFLPHHLAIGGPVAAQIHAVPVAAHLATVADLLDAGASVAEILAAGSPVAEILAAGATVADLLDAGASVADLLDAGASVAEILAAGSTVAETLAAGATVAETLAAGATVSDLLAAGATVSDLLAAGSTVSELLAAGAPVAELLAHLAPAMAGDQEEGWTGVMDKNKLRRQFNKLKKSSICIEEFFPLGLIDESVCEDDDLVCTLEVPWFPNTKSLRAAKKWSQVRKGGFVFTSEGLGRLVYGTFGEYGLEF